MDKERKNYELIETHNNLQKQLQNLRELMDEVAKKTQKRNWEWKDLLPPNIDQLLSLIIIVLLVSIFVNSTRLDKYLTSVILFIYRDYALHISLKRLP